MDDYPQNNGQDFTVNLSQTIYCKNKVLGLREIALTPTLSKDSNIAVESDINKMDYEDNVDSGEAYGFTTNDSQDKEKEMDIYLYVMVMQCSNSEAHGHKHPILRMLSLNEFKGDSAILRFPDVLYIPLKEHNLSHITVSIRLAGGGDSNCCAEIHNLLKNNTRCTFDIQDL
jgi:hypothetical protein